MRGSPLNKDCDLVHPQILPNEKVFTPFQSAAANSDSSKLPKMAHSPIRHPLHAAIVKAYDDRAPTYDSESAAFHPALAADFIKWAAAALKVNGGRHIRLLDLCCGTGLVCFAAMKHFGAGSIIHGIDISLASLQIAKAKALALKTDVSRNFEFWEGSAAELDAVPGLLRDGGDGKSGRYDLITCCSAFVLLPGDRSALLRKWAEYLLPGGIIIFDVPSPQTQFVGFDFSRVMSAYGVPTVKRDWVTSNDSVKDVIQGAGLNVLDLFETRTYTEREYKVNEAGQAWDRMADTKFMGDVSGLTEEKREEAKGKFVQMMRDRAEGKEVVKDAVRLLVGIARKPA